MIAPVRDVDGDDHDDDAFLGQHPAVAQHAVADVADDAVDVEVAGRHASVAHEPVVGRAPAGRRPRTRARGRPARPSGGPSAAWATMWRYSPCTGTNHSGRAIERKRLELLLLGVAGGVHVLDAGVHDLGAEADQPVDHLGHVRLVARDRVRAHDHDVAGTHLEPAVLVRRHQGERRHRLALRAGADDAHLGRVEVADVVDVDESAVGDVQQAHLPGQPHVLLHRHAHRGDGATRLSGGVGDLLDAVDVAGEAGRDDAPALVRRGTGRSSTPPDARLRARVARARRRWWSRTAAAGCPPGR